MKKKLIFATVAAVCMCGVATAADIAKPVYKAPVVPIYSWTGFYVGANAGYGWGDNSINVLSSPVGFVTDIICRD